MKRLFCFIVVFLFIFTSVVSAQAFWLFKSDVAEKYSEQIELALKAHQEGYPEKAKEELKRIRNEMERLIMDNLENQEFRIVLAECEFLLGYESKALKKMRIAANKGAEFQQKVFDFYMEQSKRYYKIKGLDKALKLAVLAYKEFQPSKQRRLKAASQFYLNFKEALATGYSNRQASLFFWAALELNGRLKESAKQAIVQTSQKQADPRLGIKIISLIYRLRYKNFYEEAARIVAQIMSKEKPTKASLIIDKYPEFRNFPRKVKVIVISILYPPDYTTYHRGQKKVFILSKGEYTDHYIHFERGTIVTGLIDYGKYEIHTRSGKKYSMGHVPKNMTEDFRVFAPVGCKMRLDFQ